MVQPLGKTVWRLLETVKVELLLIHDRAILLMVIYPKELKVKYQRDICTLMLTVAPFSKSQDAEAIRCPSMREWINKMCVYMQWS